MFSKVLIANRGAIATRIIRTLKKMGIASVAVYSEADADSLHVTLADDAYSLGEGAAAKTYLDQDKLFEIIRNSGAEAVHPGYGFLSENAGFVQRCEQEGVVFLGPDPEQIKVFGLKHCARNLAQENHVPLLPGSGLLEELDAALNEAGNIGYPVMLKSTAGGGGIGMQLCHDEEELSSAWDSVRRLAGNNFADSGVFLEKFVQSARHIEVQIFGDGKGGAIALGERDCSAQRRNQKVIEETPAPNIPDAVRRQLREVAVRLVQVVNYRSAGTVEFVYDRETHEFYFLEVNTRLQVEHGVTEQVWGVDLIEWMLLLGAGQLPPLPMLSSQLKPAGHSVQVRVYAEDPQKGFQPSAGLLSHVRFPEADGQSVRVDHWIEAGVEVSPFFDPMLAKVIVTADSREQAIEQLSSVLSRTEIYGIETNIDYVRNVLETKAFSRGEMTTRFLDGFQHSACSIEVLSGGTMTTIQDYPGRTGYWDVGVPPSGPFDNWSFRLGNRLLENPETAAGLEITLNGPTLSFNATAQIVLAGAEMPAVLNSEPVPFWQVIDVPAGATLKIGKVTGAGARSYLLIRGGLQCPDYLGSKSTFTLGKFGGHSGRALLAGDVLHFEEADAPAYYLQLPGSLKPDINRSWNIRVICGPHGAPEFFTEKDMDDFFAAEWEVHYNSSRTGIRLVGPKPEWARSDGGEAGMHPSNIHDNAYAIGAVDFTGDMPVILGPDGPSLGGFVCPVTIVSAERWKMGQLKAGDKVRFIPVSADDALALEQAQQASLEQLIENTPVLVGEGVRTAPVLLTIPEEENGVKVVYRAQGDKYLLVEYGPLELDIALRFRVHALMLWLQQQQPDGMRELTPGIRSLQIHYDNRQLSRSSLLALLREAETELAGIDKLELSSRVVHIPLSWDDEACRLAIEKYMQSVRHDAPWCPSNLEFIRRINGLSSIDEVKKIVFDASYLVMGLGDVYLGAPVATPIDPRHRLVTTKYNPARTWTAENSVGIGGSYLCVYGMEGPGGYQFVGRTLQMWNRYRQTKEFEKPWLLRFFDQIRFYEVSAEELVQIRKDFPKGQYPLKIESTHFSLKDYKQFLEGNQTSIDVFTATRQQAFDEELQRWIDSGQIHFEAEQDLGNQTQDEDSLDDNCLSVESHIAGNVWQVLVKPGEKVMAGQQLMILESMKMEIAVTAPESGVVQSLTRKEGSQIAAGQRLLVLETASEGQAA
ncbi:MAG: urea carboxylase [Endozoicomonas sp.]